MNHKVEIRTLRKKKVIDTEVSVLKSKAKALAYVEDLRDFWQVPIKRKTLEVVYVGETSEPLGCMKVQAAAVDAAQAKRVASGDERVCSKGHLHATPDHAEHCGESASDRSARIASSAPPSARKVGERSTTRGSAAKRSPGARGAPGSISQGTESELAR
jgi:hypothetical protein